MNNKTPNNNNTPEILNSEILPANNTIQNTDQESKDTQNTENKNTLENFKEKLASIATNSSMLLWIIGGFLLFLMLILLLITLFSGKKTSTPSTTTPSTTTQTTNITIWGLWYEPDAINPLIAEYNKEHPKYKVVYVKQEFEHESENLAYSGAYKTKLTERLKSVGGVDIVEIHHSWLSSLSYLLSPAPASISEEIQNALFPNINEAVTSNNKVLALPLFVDTMVVLYNKDNVRSDIFSNNYTWDDFLQAISEQDIKTPLGTFSNVFHSPENLLLLFTQAQLQPRLNLTSSEALSATRFYVDLYRTNNLWTPQDPLDLKAFVQCKADLVFAPSWRYINFINSNPDIQIGVANCPNA